MDILIDVAIVTLCILVITKGAVWVIDSAVAIAHRLGVSELVIGLTVVAMGTSAPEFGVTIMAALRGMSDISVGNIVGSNIFNLGFILGGTAVIRSLKTDSKVVHRDGAFLLFGTLLLTVLLWDLSLWRLEGIVLFGMLIGYLGFLYWQKESLKVDVPSDRLRWVNPVLLIVGLSLVIIGSHFLVDSAADLARAIGISEWVIGTTIVAAGTSAPEFATSLVAALRGRPGISVGNLIGSDIFNVFGVLGLAAIMRNLPVDIDARSNLVMLAMMVLIVLVFMRTGWQVSRREGFVLVALGLARWIYSF